MREVHCARELCAIEQVVALACLPPHPTPLLRPGRPGCESPSAAAVAAVGGWGALAGLLALGALLSLPILGSALAGAGQGRLARRLPLPPPMEVRHWGEGMRHGGGRGASLGEPKGAA